MQTSAQLSVDQSRAFELAFSVLLETAKMGVVWNSQFTTLREKNRERLEAGGWTDNGLHLRDSVFEALSTQELIFIGEPIIFRTKGLLSSNDWVAKYNNFRAKTQQRLHTGYDGDQPHLMPEHYKPIVMAEHFLTHSACDNSLVYLRWVTYGRSLHSFLEVHLFFGSEFEQAGHDAMLSEPIWRLFRAYYQSQSGQFARRVNGGVHEGGGKDGIGTKFLGIQAGQHGLDYCKEVGFMLFPIQISVAIHEHLTA